MKLAPHNQIFHRPHTTIYSSSHAPYRPARRNDETEIQELSLLYDVTRPEDITMVITEAGIIPVQSVPVLLRDYNLSWPSNFPPIMQAKIPIWPSLPCEFAFVVYNLA
ncbi:hypothetical protein KEM48_011848 [Puccinia striiformis f. sp. tritici PST-130]|nr:hypothetical protein KEM48_011848 [Puccinia striiformis f. sp. tritici PST-130]